MFRRELDKNFRPTDTKYKVVAWVGVGSTSRNTETAKVRIKGYFFCKRAHRGRQWEVEADPERALDSCKDVRFVCVFVFFE